jgi:phosphoadenosine phosphosulfate reductase
MLSTLRPNGAFAGAAQPICGSPSIAPGRAGVAEQVDALTLRLVGASPQEVLQVALGGEFDGSVAAVSSFGTESAVLLHMIAEIDRATPVLFLDTGYLFPETLAYRDELIERLGLVDVRSLRPDSAAVRRADPGNDLWARDPDLCCRIRKVLPLETALAGFDGWINGRKRHHGGARAHLAMVEADGQRVKFNPLAGMSRADVSAYFERNALPKHPLESIGFASVGCIPCTSRVRPGEEQRAGRWRGQGRTECGIHVLNASGTTSSDLET